MLERILSFYLLSIFCFWALALEAQNRIVINEIHYNPDLKTEPVEFIELLNAGQAAIDLSGWQFSDGIQFTFPAGTLLGPGQYLVIAENPVFLERKFRARALGPWQGSLENDGEKIRLQDAAGLVADEVDYQLGFPWPTVGDPPGFSIELVHPGLDNNLGGSWRASVVGESALTQQTLIPSGSAWKYFRGTQEPSSPVSAWRNINFDDSAWGSGPAPIGYGESVVKSALGEMRGNYTSVYLRKPFHVADPAGIGRLTLEVLYDDGFNVWVNGRFLLGRNMPSAEVRFNGVANTARESLNYDLFDLSGPLDYLQPGTNFIAIQAHNSSLSASSDFFIDARLRSQSSPSGRGPTPGAVNSVWAADLPPQIRQVEFIPDQPRSGEAVLIQAKATDPDGVSEVSLEYQVVDPGNYIEIDDPAYQTNWVSSPMNDRGLNGDRAAGDDIYSIELPAGLQIHRRLVRFRIRASDRGGRGLTAPYADDPQPNFAYFVYDGVPAWRGAARPGITPVVEFGAEEMRRLPVYHLLSKRASVEQATWIEKYTGDQYKWNGTLVYDGKVYDHIRYRMRGGVWRYAMGKNMWKFDFNRGHDFQARDNYGRKYRTKWTKLNFGACIQQGNYDHRGEQGMFEAVGFRLFNLAGVAGSHAHWIQFRIIDAAPEADANNQYAGDFWGLYLVIEQMDGRFLDEHDMPDGNFYKMENGTGELNNQGPTGPSDKSDLTAFMSGYRSGTQSDAWWRSHFDLASYYSYQAIVQGIHHYDICYGKNYFYYLNPDTAVWSQLPWDLDLIWADNMYDSGCGGRDEFKDRVLPRAAFNLEYKNRVRELRDLLFNSDQAFALIDEYAGMARGSNPRSELTILGADRAMWDYNPVLANSSLVNLSKAGHGRFYQFPLESRTNSMLKGSFEAAVRIMKNYVNYRGSILDSLAADAQIPSTPSIRYLGPTNFPINQLVFGASEYRGLNPFGALKWRVAEVTTSPEFDPAKPRKYEINADWESEVRTAFEQRMTIPAAALKVGRAYRARVRMKDTTGRWSRWSEPIQFSASEPDRSAELINHLKVSELMYRSPAGSDFDFIELHNTSTTGPLDLEAVTFTQGINFTFPPTSRIEPGGYLLVVKAADFSAFRAFYGLAANVAIAGPYLGNLSDGGEQVTLKTAAAGAEIFNFNYQRGSHWPAAADGAGHSLVPLGSSYQRQQMGALSYYANWRGSAFIKGSPGKADPELGLQVVLNEIAAHTNFRDPQRPEFNSNDWIELYNPTPDVVNLSGWHLSDDAADLRKWSIPAITIPPRGWVTFDEISGFHKPISAGFGLSKGGEQAFLSLLKGGAEDRVIDAVSFKGIGGGETWSRLPDGGHFWATTEPSRGVANRPGSPPVRINEIMYHPPDIGGTNDNTRDEFIELFNDTASTANLSNAVGVWRLGGGIGFDFPTNLSLSPGEIMLVVNFDPTDASVLGAFRTRYELSHQALKIVGPYSGKLNNSSDEIRLEKPQPPDQPGDAVSWAVVDEAVYADQTPWPAEADGTGSSLHRTTTARSGNDPGSWSAGQPSPGQGQPGAADTDGDGMSNAWELEHGLNPMDRTDAALDSDGDGHNNLAEFMSGTDPQNGQSALRFAPVQAANDQLVLRFTAIGGRSYRLEFRDALGEGNWIKLAEFEAQPETRLITITNAVSDSKRFYRVGIPASP